MMQVLPTSCNSDLFKQFLEHSKSTIALIVLDFEGDFVGSSKSAVVLNF